MFGGGERDMDSDMIRVWHLVQELSEQVSHNMNLVRDVAQRALALKVCSEALKYDIYNILCTQERVVQNKSPYALRRFQVDIYRGSSTIV